ncbi:ubiquinol oxidase subunit II [Blochmannia endosymbiont of Camponotus (Colobopsis) obliquus]|uniref:ubiquinol oxidase subunit II n=1 Tax=Blochmannia endosymbiont of Camponotus (Colobopsis) obliquus TaxID=1505597 RepID=UPI00061A6391|nr:ubiquinol oxidase subunit II [Blochmannia endosymbiont of Camponotus (Colobopsis) obliquus]AKC60409.1 ubiquinol oxidase subunit 2 [Blochmannia endosymbiont of Camponotus (Colobopsis) obliquus]
MNFQKNKKKIKILLTCINVIILNGCSNIILMHPKGQIGVEELKLVFTALGMMLIIVIPVIIMTVIFAIKYRISNNQTKYNPNWSDSKKIETTIWSLPIIIITILAIITWKSTHKLDPNKPIESNKQPIIIEVIALDWKWLFIYPKYNIAVINKVVFPNNTPIKFEITSNSVMNAFFIPQLGGQIYAMAGMNSTLNLIANTPGTYKGISSNFSGRGFSNMKFIAIATKNEQEFYQWIQDVKKSNKHINTISDYEKLALPTENHPVTYFSNVKPNLFNNVINKFM